MLKSMLSPSEEAAIVSRNEPVPLSFRFVTVRFVAKAIAGTSQSSAGKIPKRSSAVLIKCCTAGKGAKGNAETGN
jgi:hypothetical protein